MNPKAMDPFGMALVAYLEGEETAELIIRRDDGLEIPLPVSYFFRGEAGFSPIDNAAVERCAGRILDAGAGAGPHSLAVQRRGQSVTAIDISIHAVDVMRRRGVTDARCANIFEFRGGPFDTLLLLGHGIGMVETLAGLDRFLSRSLELLNESGQVLLDSVDVRTTYDPAHLAYHEANRAAGRYVGETRLQPEFHGRTGPYCGWLHVDSQTLKQHAEKAGWQCNVVLQEEDGNHLARLTKQTAP